ncbi:hook-length control protein FliK [Thermodesulfobium acidiphilum]|uniref:Hook-length control protein FliK n=1 Tax=Thermodesulfobium acidiphilum TaxID=1794699 RepID=A0A2R4W2S2_THEAF|nr:flagellar hook-length control protein FliK [Thermodesulfobium acidiphilum]AWB11107.1 hook-length control protein FliK [Thermodesulfobium acidiphilum]
MNSSPLANLPILQSGNSVPNPNQSSISQDEVFSSILEQLVSEFAQNEVNTAQSSQINIQTTNPKSQLQPGSESSDQSVSGQIQSSLVLIQMPNQMPVINLSGQIPVVLGLNLSQDQNSAQSALKDQTNKSNPTLTQPDIQILGPLQDAQIIPLQLADILNSSPVLSSQASNGAINIQNNSNVLSTIQTNTQSPFLLESQLTVPQAQSTSQSTLIQTANLTPSSQLAQNSTPFNLNSIQALQSSTNISQDNSGENDTTLINSSSLNTLSNLSQNLQTISDKSFSTSQLALNSQVFINQPNLSSSITGTLTSSQNLNQQAFNYQNQSVAQNISNTITSQILSNLSIPSSVNSQITVANLLSGQIASGFNQANSLSNSSENKLTDANEAISSNLLGPQLSIINNIVTPNQSMSYHSISLDAYQKIQNMMQDLRFNSPKDIEFLLEPPDLGKVKLNVSLDRATNSVNMTFFVVDDLAKHAILSNMQDFRQILQSNGFAPNNVNVYINSDQKDQGFNQNFSHVIYPLNNNNNVSLDTALITGIQSLKDGVDIRV